MNSESAVESPLLMEKEKIGVLLLNLGGPQTLCDDILRLPRLFKILLRPLAQLISVLVAPGIKRKYAAIGGGLPLRKITFDQYSKHATRMHAFFLPVCSRAGEDSDLPNSQQPVYEIDKQFLAAPVKSTVDKFQLLPEFLKVRGLVLEGNGFDKGGLSKED
ncbi:hypothetical protein LguiA_033444 [Lonicera macranthoides]